MKRVALFLVALLCLGWGSMQIGGMADAGGGGATPDHRYAFNTNGSNSTHASCSGDCDLCTEHGFDANATGYVCNAKPGSEPEGDGVMSSTADDPDYLTDDSRWSADATVWAQMELQPGALDNASSKAFFVWRSGAANLGYHLLIDGPENEIDLVCNGTTYDNAATISASTWITVRFKAETTTGLCEVWINGVSKITGDPAGDTETTDGFALWAAVDASADGYDIDDVQIFLSDPGW